MAFDSFAALTIAELTTQIAPAPSVIEFGNQTFTAAPSAVRRVIKMATDHGIKFDIELLSSLLAMDQEAKSECTESFYKALGFKSYAAIDLNADYGALMMDLNRDLQSEYGYKEMFDLVTNNGTGEHVFNQFTVFKNAHDLTRPGGLMFHRAPFNVVNHGFYNMNPIFYVDLAHANGYEIVQLGLADNDWIVSNLGGTVATVSVEELASGFTQEMTKGAKFGLRHHLTGIESRKYKLRCVAILRKRHDAPFIVPLQNIYLADVESDEIGSRYTAQISEGRDAATPRGLWRYSRKETYSRTPRNLFLFLTGRLER